LVPPKGKEDGLTQGKMGSHMSKIMQQNGLISRNMVDAMAFCPPLIINPNEIADILRITHQSLSELAFELGTPP
jgi:4-aminobutyrate--pyruvate transaminase